MTHDRGHNDRERGCAHANEHEDERRALLLLRGRSKRANGVIAQARKKELEETIQFCSFFKWYPRLANKTIRAHVVSQLFTLLGCGSSFQHKRIQLFSQK